MSNTNQRRILEAVISTPAMQPTVGVDEPKEVHQCQVCSGFIVTSDANPELPGSCPHCGATPLVTKNYGAVTDQIQPARDVVVQREPAVVHEKEAEEVLEDALELLDEGDAEKYSEMYKDITAMNSKGELVTVVESAVARRRVNAKQRSTYRLAEKISNESKVNTNRLKAIRLNAFMINEARNIKRRAQLSTIYEGVEDDVDELEDRIEEELQNADYTDYIEDILDDKEVEEKIAEEDDKGAVETIIKEILEDAGLDVISSEVIDEDATGSVVAARVVDSDDVEFHTSELEEAIDDLVEGEIAVNGVEVPGAETDVIDLEVVIQNADSVREELEDELEEDALNKKVDRSISESFRRRGRRGVRPSRRRRYGRAVLESKDDDIEGDVTVEANGQVDPEEVVEAAAELIGDEFDAEFTGGTLVVEYKSKDELEEILDTLEEVIEDDVVAEYVKEDDMYEELEDEEEEGLVVVEESAHITPEELEEIADAAEEEGFDVEESRGTVEIPYTSADEKEEILEVIQDELGIDEEYLEDITEREIVHDLDEGEDEDEESINEFLSRVNSLSRRLYS